MSANYSHIIDECIKYGPIVVDPARGRDGLWGTSIVAGDKYFFIPQNSEWEDFRDKLLKSAVGIAVWDLRRISDWPLTSERIIWDVKSLWGGEMNLPATIRFIQNTFSTRHPVFERYLDLDQKVVAHTRALKTTHIDLPTVMAIPTPLLTDWIKSRTAVVYDIYKMLMTTLTTVAVRDEYRSRWPFILQLRKMEKNGIAIDLAFVEEQLNGDPEPATGKALRSLQGLCRDGYVTTLINPMGAKTGRIRHEGGFNTLGIPHGPARNAIKSRWDGGLIYTFDFNAIDYRCIVKSVGGEVAKLYEGSQDFHERTASFVFKEVNTARRTAIKYLSYIYIYGGSDETVVAKTGWTIEQVRSAITALDKRIMPIKEFREKLWMTGHEKGFIQIPGGREVLIGSDDSPGKVVGLFAQSYSSWVFEQAFTKVSEFLNVGLHSLIVFAVHDELVIDVHPDEFDRMNEVLNLMQNDGSVVKVKKGPTYGEQS